MVVENGCQGAGRMKKPLSKTAARKKRGKDIARWQKVKAKRLKRMASLYGLPMTDKPRAL